ncbi:hypothetical protein IW262DRAFT_852671 [Armillaria fumosa]|nr:hypothetical protein IW262DRAFT_852671 [Armillaria fumosa]
MFWKLFISSLPIPGFLHCWMIPMVRRRRDSLGSVKGQHPLENGLDRDLHSRFSPLQVGMCRAFPVYMILFKYVLLLEYLVPFCWVHASDTQKC